MAHIEEKGSVMLGLRRADEYEIAVCGYTSDLGGKNLQSEWYAIKVPNPDPDLYSFPSLDPERYAIRDPNTDPDPDPFLDIVVFSCPSLDAERYDINPDPDLYLDPYLSSPPSPAPPPSPDFSIEKMGINPSIGKKQVDLSPSAKEKDGILASSIPYPGDEFVASSYRPGCTHLFSLGGLDPVGSDSDGDGAHPFESERCLKVWSLEVNKPDAGWKAVPLMTFPNRYNPQSVVQNGKLYVFGGFSRSQFPAEAAAKGVGWMESYNRDSGWKPLPNPPFGFFFNDDPLIFTTIDEENKILLAQYNHDDMTCDSATFYVYDVVNKLWRILDPPVRKLLARYPDRTGRRCVAVGYTLYWGLFEDEDINVQAYDLDRDIWFHGSLNFRRVLRKDEFLADNVFPASPPLLHLANQIFCLFLLTSIYDEKNCEVSNLYLNCVIFHVSPINDEGDNHQHDYYDHVCCKVRDDVNVDDKKDNANYHVHPHDHFWRLSISIMFIQRYPLVNPIQLWDAGVLSCPVLPQSLSTSGLKFKSV